MVFSKLYKDWKKAKDVFVKPKLIFKFYSPKYVCSFCTYDRYVELPFVKIFMDKTHVATDYTIINRPEGGRTVSRHKIPVWTGMRVWNSKIRRTLRKYGLWWIKPEYIRPNWMVWCIYSTGIVWKLKYNEVRFEYPPEVNITLFGYTFQIIAIPPVPQEPESIDDCYYEGILNYIRYKDKTTSIKDFIIHNGSWLTSKEDNSIMSIDRNWIVDKYKPDWDEAYKQLITASKNKSK